MNSTLLNLALIFCCEGLINVKVRSLRLKKNSKSHMIDMSKNGRQILLIILTMVGSLPLQKN